MSLKTFDPRLGVQFADAAEIRRKLAYLCRPANKSPVLAADEGLWISDGTDVTKFLSSQVPYIREPMECLSRRIYEAVILMGPARSGKTKGLVEGWINYTVTQDPGDMLLIYSTKKKAESMSKKDLARCFAATEEINKLRTGRKSDDTLTFKHFLNGMNLSLDSATESSLSAETFRYAGCSDYDRADDGVGQEGSKFQLMLKRIQNAKSSGMAMAESSPGRLVRQPKSPAELGPHEAQPCGGIAQLYNQGDRRRFYWQCDDCGFWFLPDFETLHWEDKYSDPQDVAKSTYCQCPRCLHRIDEHQKQEKSLAARWFREGAVDSFGLVETAVEGHQVAQQVVADVAHGLFRDPGQQHLLHHTRCGAHQEAAEDHQPDPPQRAGVAANEDLVEHRLHHVAEQPEHRAFDRHEDQRDGQQPAVLPEVSPPEPDEEPLRVGRRLGHASSSGGRLASKPACSFRASYSVAIQSSKPMGSRRLRAAYVSRM